MRIATIATAGLMLLLGLLAPVAGAQTYDLVILNGRVIDPETKLDAVRNVGIKDGRIEVVTEKKLSGKETIDATDYVVAPGFIDLHVHGQDPYGIKLQLRDGVTTAMELEIGAYPVEDYYNAKKNKSQVNYGASVSHAGARMAVLDGVDPKGLFMYSGVLKDVMHDGAQWYSKPYDPADTTKVAAAVEKGLRQGGLGIGFAIGYYTKVGSPEVVSVAGLAKRYDSFITTHVRYLAQTPPSGYLGLEEMLAVAKLNNTPLLVHHVPSNCMALTPRALDAIDQANKEGMKVVGEFYPYTFASSIIGADYLAEGFREHTGMDYSDIVDIATGQKMTKETLAKYRKEEPSRQIIFYSMKDKDMLAAFKRPGVFVGCDSMPYIPDGKEPITWDSPYGYGLGHPRAAGTHARVLRLVREQNVVPLMEAIAKLSYYQARFLQDMAPQMKYRGRVQPGAIADITIFDSEAVQDHADWVKGKNSLPSTGIPYVIVNGTVVVKDSKVLKDVFPGQPIRKEVLD